MFLLIKTDTADKSIASDIGLLATETTVTGVLASISLALFTCGPLQKVNKKDIDRKRKKTE
jgi:hypothetical protein